jgi:NAD(P)-dependent dehydrogenase (short-subunit alcohol dehydrogenase family)
VIDSFNISGKNILISGANGFLGKHLFEYILNKSGNPILIDINNNNILKSKFKKKIENNSLYFKTDITDEIEVKNSLRKIEKKFKKIDGLVNLAALAMPQMKNTKSYFENFEKYNFDLWKKSIDINLNGTFLITQQVVKIMKKRKYGSIVNMSSDVSVISPDHSIYKSDSRVNYKGVKFNTPISYVVSKTGILGFTRYLATYYAKNNIRVNSISPSGVYNNQPKKFVKKLSSKIPLGRMAKPEEIVNGIIYLLSDASSFSTGSNLIIDGGRTII